MMNDWVQIKLTIINAIVIFLMCLLGIGLLFIMWSC